MIHINRGDGLHEMLTDEEFQMRYPEVYANLRRPAPHEQFGRILSRARQDANISVRELAKKLGIRASELSDIDHGRVEISSELSERYLTAVSELRNERRVI